MVSTNKNIQDKDTLSQDAWCERVAENRSPENMKLLQDALQIAFSSLHNDPQSKPAFEDSLTTAELLHELRLDTESLVAAIVSSSVLKKQLDIKTIENKFGNEVAQLVDGICKMNLINRFNQKTVIKRHEDQAENLRRMLLAMANDVRVVLITLAARVVAMRSVKNHPDTQKRAIARETMDIYAPLANRLGIWQFKWELEDLSIRYLDPDVYSEIAALLSERRLDREEYINNFMSTLKARFDDAGVDAQISGRPKHIYSIWRKMKRKQLSFDQIFDIRAVRIIVPTINQCYEALGIVHSDYNHIRGEFDDYIASPKDNMYQSLHTAVLGPQGQTVEIQIRTPEMHHHSELGVAAHWRYKEDAEHDGDFERKVLWLRQLLEWKDDISSTEEFIDELKDENIPDRIYVFTPKGKVIDLPEGSTPLDFAYRVHTEIGHRCRGAKVNGKIIQLTQQLDSGQIVEILTVKNGGPSRDWLNPNLGYINSAKARSKVHSWFKLQNHEENVAQGRAIIEKELQRLGVNDISFEKIAQHFNHAKVDRFFAAVGRTDIRTGQVVNFIQETTEPREEKIPVKRPRKSKASKGSDVYINGVGNLLTQIAKCCNPLPGDAIVGYITHGRGVTIHRQDCGNALQYSNEEKDRLVSVQWADHTDNTYPVGVQIVAHDRSGLLSDITFVLANEGINVVGVNTRSDKTENKAYMSLTLEIKDLGQLSKVLSQVSQLPNIIEARRMHS